MDGEGEHRKRSGAIKVMKRGGQNTGQDDEEMGVRRGRENGRMGGTWTTWKDEGAAGGLDRTVVKRRDEVGWSGEGLGGWLMMRV